MILLFREKDSRVWKILGFRHRRVCNIFILTIFAIFDSDFWFLIFNSYQKKVLTIELVWTSREVAEAAYSELCQISKMKLFAKIFQSLTMFSKGSILDARQGCEYAFATQKLKLANLLSDSRLIWRTDLLIKTRCLSVTFFQLPENLLNSSLKLIKNRESYLKRLRFV